jgi:hypothetical protein
MVEDDAPNEDAGLPASVLALLKHDTGSVSARAPGSMSGIPADALERDGGCDAVFSYASLPSGRPSRP